MGVKYLCSGLLLAMVVSLAPVYGGTNLLENPGFESGTKGWTDRACKIEAVTTPVHSGSGSVKVFGRTETWQGVKQSILGKVSSGKTYKISGWVRLEVADMDTVTLSIEQTDDAETKYININSNTVDNSEWVELSGEFTLNATGALKTLDVYFEGPAADVNFFVDDVNVYGDTAAGQADPNAPKAKITANPRETGQGTITDADQIGAGREAALGRQRN
jgi:endo-1,4-beta-xylanase